jgi:hypothetical protein
MTIGCVTRNQETVESKASTFKFDSANIDCVIELYIKMGDTKQEVVNYTCNYLGKPNGCKLTKGMFGAVWDSYLYNCIKKEIRK